MEVNQVARPPLFPCADRVKVPQVGADERNILNSSFRLSLPSERHSETHEKLNNEYLKKICTDLTFSEDVVKTHAAHTLPYNKDELKSVFKHDKVVKKRKKVISGPVGRNNARGTENKHMPCHIQTVSEHKLKPLKTKSIFKPHKNEEEEDTLSEKSDKTAKKNYQNVFLTEFLLNQELGRDAESEIEIKPSQSKTWDAHVLMKLSKNTARWIVSEKTQDGVQKERLDSLLEGVYGSPSGAIDTLIRDDASISDSGEREAVSRMSGKVAWNKVVTNFSAKEKPKQEEPLASFYRLPAGVRRQQRLLDKEAAGAINTTARDIKIHRKKPKPPPTLKDVMNPLVGDKMFDTSNQFEQEWLSGAQQMYKPLQSKILLDSGNLYQVHRQEDFPPVSEKWSKTVDEKNKKNALKKGEESRVLQKGYRRWTTLPEYVEAKAMNVHEAGYDPEANRIPSPNTQMTYRENPSLVKLVDEWRGKWHLGNKWSDSSIGDLMRDLKDINEHVRLTAVATVARAATFRPPPEPGIPIKGASRYTKLKKPFKEDQTAQLQGILPDNLMAAVENALRDESKRVRITAAIALYTLNRPNEEARKLLHDLVRNGSAPERWAAAQCLAHAGVCDSYVVGELVNKLFQSEDVIKNEQCLALMAKLSENSSIVHSMVAEQLNSTSWRQRIIACKALPRLYGIINKDITHKVCNLMWNDWHKEVRMVAAHTLGKTGHGKEVHHDLRERLINGTERDRIDSLHKIGHLGIMTARLLPAYLQCFDDPYIAVRIAATNTAGKLELRERQVLRKLLFLTQFDPNWKVKAYAIKAIGMIGELSDPIQEAIIWALRFETEPGVRAEACDSLVKLGIKGPDISAILQDKLLVEPNELVRRQLANALEWMGVSSTGDMEMVQQIKDEVRRLCTRYNIAAKITKNEEWEDKHENHRALFNSSPNPSEFEKTHQIESPPLTRPSTKLSLRTGTPNIYVTSEDGRRSRAESPDLFLPTTPVAGEDSEDNTRETSYHPSTAKSSDSLEESGVDNVSQRFPSAHSRQGSVRSGSVCSNASRKTPVEKLEKLIELYEGSCTLQEYEKYVRPAGDEEVDAEHNQDSNEKMEGRDAENDHQGNHMSNLRQEINEQSETNIIPVSNNDESSPEGKVSVESIAISSSIYDADDEDSGATATENIGQNLEVTLSPQNDEE